MIDYSDDTETNNENDEIVKLGLIFGQPVYNGTGVEVTYKGTKIIITPTSYKRAIQPITKLKRNQKYESIPAYMITAGNSGGTIEKSKANAILRNLKAKIDRTPKTEVLEEGFLSTMLSAASDVALKGMGFGEIPGQAADMVEREHPKGK